MKIKRRKFIQTVSMAGGGLLLLPSCSKSASLWRFFTQTEAATVISIAEQIIPADDMPGATDAHVIDYIDTQLAGYFSNHQETYRKGLAALQQFCIQKHSLQFEKLEWDTQTQVLKLMEKNSLEGDYWKENPPSRFFRMLRDHSMQGFYGSPRHGGNKNYVSYKMLNLNYPHVLGQNRYSSRSQTLNIYKR